jgi:hypothetical protein
MSGFDELDYASLAEFVEWWMMRGRSPWSIDV